MVREEADLAEAVAAGILPRAAHDESGRRAWGPSSKAAPGLPRNPRPGDRPRPATGSSRAWPARRDSLRAAAKSSHQEKAWVPTPACRQHLDGRVAGAGVHHDPFHPAQGMAAIRSWQIGGFVADDAAHGKVQAAPAPAAVAGKGRQVRDIGGPRAQRSLFRVLGDYRRGQERSHASPWINGAGTWRRRANSVRMAARPEKARRIPSRWPARLPGRDCAPGNP